MISDWTLVEAASALALKVRAGHLTPEQARAVRSHLDRWATDSFETLAIGRDAFRGATRLLDRPGTQLRAGDALHLAIAQDEGTTLVTFDVVLASEAASAGIAVDDPTDPDA